MDPQNKVHAGASWLDRVWSALGLDSRLTQLIYIDIGGFFSVNDIWYFSCWRWPPSYACLDMPVCHQVGIPHRYNEDGLNWDWWSSRLWCNVYKGLKCRGCDSNWSCPIRVQIFFEKGTIRWEVLVQRLYFKPYISDLREEQLIFQSQFALSFLFQLQQPRKPRLWMKGLNYRFSAAFSISLATSCKSLWIVEFSIKNLSVINRATQSRQVLFYQHCWDETGFYHWVTWIDFRDSFAFWDLLIRTSQCFPCLRSLHLLGSQNAGRPVVCLSRTFPHLHWRALSANRPMVLRLLVFFDLFVVLFLWKLTMNDTLSGVSSNSEPFEPSIHRLDHSAAWLPNLASESLQGQAVVRFGPCWCLRDTKCLLGLLWGLLWFVPRNATHRHRWWFYSGTAWANHFCVWNRSLQDLLSACDLFFPKTRCMLLGSLRQTQQACKTFLVSCFWTAGCGVFWISRDTLRETDENRPHRRRSEGTVKQVICMLDDLDSALIQFEVHLVVGVVELHPGAFGTYKMALNSWFLLNQCEHGRGGLQYGDMQNCCIHLQWHRWVTWATVPCLDWRVQVRVLFKSTASSTLSSLSSSKAEWNDGHHDGPWDDQNVFDDVLELYSLQLFLSSLTWR